MKNILFCGNCKVFDGMLSAMLSIFKRTDSKEPFTFFIFTMDVSHLKPDYTPLTDGQVAFLEELAKSYNSENRVVKIDVTDAYMREFSGCPNEGCYCSPYTLIRLFADLYEEIPEKLLYLDVDILFNRDIDLLWNTDIEGFECKKTGLFEKCRELIKTKKLVFADEGAIIRCTTKKKMLSQRFNDQKFLYKNTVIRHFSKRLFWTPYPHTANIKQWNVTKIHKIFGYENFDDILYEYIYQKNRFEREICSVSSVSSAETQKLN